MALLAGQRQRRYPAFLFRSHFVASLLVGGLAGSAALAQEVAATADITRCDHLPEERRDLCWMVTACGALADEGRREECYRIAADTLRHGGSRTSEGSAEPASATSGERDPPATAPVASETSRTLDADESHAAERSSPPSQVTVKTVAREVLDIPRRFSAQVTGKRELVRNRQLLALDDRLLFETDQADTADIDVGDQVDVVKASSALGRSFQITGPARRAVVGLRIRCERLDLGARNRRHCSAMVGSGNSSPR